MALGSGLLLPGIRDIVHGSRVLPPQVYTSDVRGAGTDANVSIKLAGTNGKETGLQRLENSKNNFERGAEDVFFLELPDLEELAYIEVGHDNSGFAPG